MGYWSVQIKYSVYNLKHYYLRIPISLTGEVPMNPRRPIYPHMFRNMFYVYVRILTPVLSNVSYSPDLPSVASKCDAPVHNYKPEETGRLLEEEKL
jgi:hypothetical protein